MNEVEREVLHLTGELLRCIANADWTTYERLCDPSLSCFEPEARGQLVEGLPFHRHYFGLGPSASPRLDTIARPHVRVMGEVGVVSYVRLIQRIDAGGSPGTDAAEETRVWHKTPEGWKLVHFHRSPVGG